MTDTIVDAESLWRLLQQSSLGIAVIHRSGRLLHANLSYCRLVGKDEAELRQGALADLTNPTEHERDERLLEELLAGSRDALVLERHYRHRDGQEVWARLNIAVGRWAGEGEVVLLATAEDVTQARRLALKLDEREQLLRNAARIARLGTWDADLVSGHVTWSAETYELLGVPAAFAVTLTSFIDLVHPDDRERLKTLHLSSLTDDAPFEAWFRVIRPDGQVRTMHERGEVACDSTGRPVRRFGIIQDVTASEEALSRLREGETRLRLLSRATNDAIWDWDIRADTLWWSDSCRALFGLAANAHGPTLSEWNERVHPGDRAAVVSSLQAAIDGELETWSEQYRVKRDDGSFADVLDRGYIIRDEGRKAIRMVGGMSDITTLRASEREVTEQGLLLEQATDAIIVRDLDLNVQRWNRGAERLYGLSAATVRGRAVAEFVGELRTIHGEALAAVLETGGWSHEFKIRRATGEDALVLARWSRLDHLDGSPRAILAIETDVTDRKAAETHMLRAQRLESLGTLAGGIAHDLNNVLTPILLSLELLKDDAADEDKRETLSTIEQSALRGTDMVRQMLSFARGMDGRRLSVKVASTMEEMGRIVRETFPKAISFSLDLEPGLPAVLGDPTQIHQVLLNLCVNARDAMPTGGTLRLSARAVEVDAHYAGLEVTARPGRYVLLEVSDTGTGIPPEVRERIFEPFFTTKPTGQGTGLGLSTTQAIIRSHQGFLRVDSTMGKGSRFSVYLPAAQGAAVDETASAPVLRRGAGELILVVDDEAPVREITLKTLVAFGYRVVTATEGSEAIAQLAQRRDEIRLVITDLMMPKMDGHATIPVLRHLAPHLPILAVSGVGGAGSLGRAISYGATAVLAKPFTAMALLDAVWNGLNSVSAGQARGARAPLAQED